MDNANADKNDKITTRDIINKLQLQRIKMFEEKKNC